MRPRDLDEKAYIGAFCVSTVGLAIEHHGGMWYETYIFPADGKEITGWGEVWGTRYATKPEAVEGHARVCKQLRAGELEDFNGDTLQAAQPSPRTEGGAAE